MAGLGYDGVDGCQRRLGLAGGTPGAMHDTYYHADDLGRFPEIGKNRPELAEKFFAWYNAVFVYRTRFLGHTFALRGMA